MNGHMATCALCLQVKSRRGTGRKPRMELRHLGVAAVTKVTNLLKHKHVPVGTAMRAVACPTAFDAGRTVFKYKGP